MKPLATKEFKESIKQLEKIGRSLTFKEYNKRRGALDQRHRLYLAEKSHPTVTQMEQGRGKDHKVSKVDYVKLMGRELILEAIGGMDVFVLIVSKVAAQAKRGSFKHQELLMNYILGRPTEKIKLDASGTLGGAHSPTVVKIIADHLRLERLNNDANAAPVISEDRIKDMEDTLNNAVDGKD